MNTHVDFETAKLLKEKGFDLKCKSYYRITSSGLFKTNKSINHNDDISQKTAGGMTYVSAPTIAEVVMWLYEEHGIWIYSYPVQPFDNGDEYPKIVWVVKCISMNQVMFEKFIDAHNGLAINHHNSPTEAYEAAILYTLNNLI